MVYIEEMDRSVDPEVELATINWGVIRQGWVYGSLKAVYLRIRLKERGTNTRKLVL
jgi:hypothetical protein